MLYWFKLFALLLLLHVQMPNLFTKPSRIVCGRTTLCGPLDTMGGPLVYRGTSPIRTRPPPYDPPTTLDTGLR